MKIAYMGVKGLPSKGGTERVVEAIVRQLAGKHEITVYCDSDYTPADTVVPGVRLIRISSVPGKYIHPTLLFLLHALHALFLGDYDLIHMHGVDACFTLPLLRLRYQVIATSHGSQTRLARKKWGKAGLFLLSQTEKPFCYLSNLATSVSYPDIEFYQARYHSQVTYIPNGVDEKITYDMEAARALLAEHGIQPGNYILFAAGRIDPTKGCHLALEAFNQVKPDIPLLIVGNLEELPSYAAELRHMAVNRPVVFLPLIKNRALLYGIVKLCRLFIFPSLSEGMSIMLLEVGTLGVPVVCSDIEENRTVMKNAARYFHSGDARDLAVQLSYALDQPEQMQVLGERARTRLLKSLSWNRVANYYDRLYDVCLRGGASQDLYLEWSG